MGCFLGFLCQQAIRGPAREQRSWFAPGVSAQEAADGEEPDRGEDPHQQQRQQPGHRSQPAGQQGRDRAAGERQTEGVEDQ
jgi:hypothetical protein